MTKPIAILCNNENSFPLPLTFGLQRMFSRIGAESHAISYGWKFMRLFSPSNDKPIWKRLALSFAEEVQPFWFKRLSKYGAIVVVGTIPSAFRRMFINIQEMRKVLPDTPIILYDVFSLLDKRQFAEELAQNGDYLMELYDHYLLASPIENKEFQLHHSSTYIGLDLQGEPLYARKKEFSVILDFPRKGFEEYRQIQKAALKRTGIPYIELKGTYPRRKLLRIFRENACLFLSFPESFGLPICEMQACGGMVIGAHEFWAHRHRISAADSSFSENFNFYNNEVELLCEMLQQAKQVYDPMLCRRRFLDSHPHYYYGNEMNLQSVTEKINQGRITGKSHLKHDLPDWVFQPVNCKLQNS